MILIQKSLLLLNQISVFVNLIILVLQLCPMVLDLSLITSLYVISVQLPLIDFLIKLDIDHLTFFLEHIVDLIKSHTGVMDLIDVSLSL